MKKTKKKTRDITTFNKRVDAVLDTTDNLFDRVTRKDQASLGIMLMSSAMTNLYQEGYFQHQIVDMTIDAVQEFVDMEVDFCKEDGIEPFPKDGCTCKIKKPSFMQKLSKATATIN